MANTIIEGDMIIMNMRNEIKAYIVREGFTMSELVEKLAEQYGWSPSVPNLSDKLRRESLHYKEAVLWTAPGSSEIFGDPPLQVAKSPICCAWKTGCQ